MLAGSGLAGSCLANMVRLTMKTMITTTAANTVTANAIPTHTPEGTDSAWREGNNYEQCFLVVAFFVCFVCFWVKVHKTVEAYWGGAFKLNLYIKSQEQGMEGSVLKIKMLITATVQTSEIRDSTPPNCSVTNSRLSGNFEAECFLERVGCHQRDVWISS